ncbi:MFS transporter [Microbacterium saperdae]|uniref:EmrB/QacA subfamily drug resistance transporter n=1 Tax=Microbacterium saperdae TaxID=69368 RepID=A0A543BL35_9MICO|nr:MFS transporter [Microbacterium saperdae]TQL85545.1 EmrB/QacA subfamily drug resistance transporter [Microbacterium saperdae]
MSSSSSRRGAGAARAAGERHTNGALLVAYLALGGLSFAVLQSLVAPALGSIGHDLGVSTGDASWVLTAYLLAAAVLTPVLGRLGDMVGKRRVLIVVLVLLLVGTVLAAVAPNLTVLIMARVLQGAAGAIMPLSIGVVRDELDPDRVGVTIGLLSAIFGVGAGVGIVAAGPIVEALSWRWLFWLPAVLVVIALFGAIFGMPDSPVKTPGRIDLLGTGILTVSLVALLLGIGEGATWGWASVATVSLLIVGGVALVVFVLVELRLSAPLIDIPLWRNRGVWTAHLVALAFGFVMFGTFVLVPTLLQLPTATGYGFGVSVTASGLFLLPTVAMMVVSGPIAGLLVRKAGAKLPMLIGSAIAMLAFLVPAVGHDQLWQVVLSGALTGVGVGFALAATSNAIIESVPATQTGEAISVNTIMRTVGSSLGTAVIGAVLSSQGTSAGAPADAAFTGGFWVCAVVGAIAIAAAVMAPAARDAARRVPAARDIDRKDG